jgi:hypothetical protein
MKDKEQIEYEMRVNEKVKENLTSIDVEERYKEALDECNGEVNVAGMKFSTSYALKELDPTAFDCGMNDYIDSENFYELDGSYYNNDEVEAIRSEVEGEMEDEKTKGE